MAVHHGKNGKVKLGASALVAEVTQFTVTESVGTTDTTSMGKAAGTHLVGIPTWTAQVDAHYDPADADGQVALSIGAAVNVGLYTDGDAASKKYVTGAASVTGITITSSFSERVGFSATLQGNGPLNHETVSA